MPAGGHSTSEAAAVRAQGARFESVSSRTDLAHLRHTRAAVSCVRGIMSAGVRRRLHLQSLRVLRQGRDDGVVGRDEHELARIDHVHALLGEVCPRKRAGWFVC